MHDDHFKMSKMTCTIFMITILCASLVLTYMSFVNVPKSLAQTIPTSNQTSKARPPPPPLQIGSSPEMSAPQISASTNKTCILKPSLMKLVGTPQQTEGPYFVDGMPNRSDIRSDPVDGSVQQGIPLHVVIHVYDVDNGSCNPIRGAKIDIWHANSQGIYSSVNDQATAGKKFLRGYQITDHSGTVRFTTIYPGWYQGRTVHIHVKVRTFEGPQKSLEWTSQFYFNNSMNRQIDSQLPYSIHGPPTTMNEQDGIYTGASTDGMLGNNSGEHLMLNLAKQGQSYVGTFNIALNSAHSMR